MLSFPVSDPGKDEKLFFGFFLTGQNPWPDGGFKLWTRSLLLDVQPWAGACQASRIKASRDSKGPMLYKLNLIYFVGFADLLACLLHDKPEAVTTPRSLALLMAICPVYALFALPRICWDWSLGSTFHIWCQCHAIQIRSEKKKSKPFNR